MRAPFEPRHRLAKIKIKTAVCAGGTARVREFVTHHGISVVIRVVAVRTATSPRSAANNGRNISFLLISRV